VSDDNYRVLSEPNHKKTFINILKSLRGEIILADKDESIKENYRRLETVNAEFEHFLSICVHTLVCVLIYITFGKNNISLMTALLFAVNPATYQGGIWISGRGYAISAIVVMLYIIFGAPFYLVSLFFATNTLLAPFIFLFSNRWVDISFFLPACLYFLAKHNDSIKDRETFTVTHHRQISIPVIIKTYAYYFLHILFPVRLGMYHTFLAAYGMTDRDTAKWRKKTPLFWFGCLLVYVLATNLIFNNIAPVKGLMFYSVFIIMWCNIKMVNQEIAERYEYLAAIGLMYMLANMINFQVFAVIFALYALRGWIYLDAFKDDYSWYKMNVSPINFPDNHLAWLMMAQYQKNVLKRPFAALDTYYEGLKVRPNDMRLNIMAAGTLAQFSFYDEANDHLKLVEEHKGEYYDIEKGISTLVPELRKVIDIRLKQIEEQDKNAGVK
jgi:hypothetical protein